MTSSDRCDREEDREWVKSENNTVPQWREVGRKKKTPKAYRWGKRGRHKKREATDTTTCQTMHIWEGDNTYHTILKSQKRGGRSTRAGERHWNQDNSFLIRASIQVGCKQMPDHWWVAKCEVWFRWFVWRERGGLSSLPVPVVLALISYLSNIMQYNAMQNIAEWQGER